MTMLGLKLLEPSWRQLRSLISPLYHVHHTVQTWYHVTSTNFHPFPKIREDLRGYLYYSNEEVERIVRTWMKKQSLEFFCDGFQKLRHHWKKCVENGGDYVEN
ncbi:hypothetical protein Cfor_00279 [Coptotermes formosanus]|jgi:hypothetical protein|uniref:Uncharacterized protein n=1 Tax=Coptotermes formosanus TaxID=36987 RepID=A0A6L2PD40_COPFO|nr:hypothetical protein Cfor_00279 [Coptotermes formosanus]